MTNDNITYNFSFTGAAMKFHDFIWLANYVVDNQLDIESSARAQTNHAPGK
ncbi:MAG: hypothetical protein IPN33_26535 [Saprospiraceae bacterium]|nr:hypothetical protein [Saprospiraceae bacterium]